MKTEGGRANLLVSKEITRRFLVQRPLWDQQAKLSGNACISLRTGSYQGNIDRSLGLHDLRVAILQSAWAIR